MATSVVQNNLSLIEKKRLQGFLAEHKVYCKNVKSDYTISFCAAGGIGVGVNVKCNFCNKTHDITDYGSW